MRDEDISGDELSRIGRLGENHFERLADKAKLKWSVVTPDATGKDYVIESHLAAPADLVSFDKRQPPIHVVVQVKTILAKNDKVAVSLSVLERLAKDSRPAVIAIHQIDDDDDLITSHFIHLIGDPLARVLKALRRATSEGETQLHNRVLTFRIRNAEPVESTGPAFYAAIASLSGGDMHGYARTKLTELETLGFDTDRHRMTFNISASPDDIIDGFLALKPLNVADVVMLERRFDIELPVETVKNGTIMFEATKHTSGECWLQGSGAAGAPLNIGVRADFTYVERAITSSDKYGISARTKFGIFIIRPGQWTFKQSGSFGPNSVNSLHDWKTFLTLAIIIARGVFTMKMRSDDNPNQLDFNVSDIQSAVGVEMEQHCLELLDLLAAVNDAAGGKPALFRLNDLVAQGDLLTLIARTLVATDATFQSSTTDPGIPAIASEKGALVCLIKLVNNWIGYFMPVSAVAAAQGAGTLWTGKQTRHAVVERLDGDNVGCSFERFRKKLCELTDTQMVFLQKTGGFMENNGMMDLRVNL